MYRNNLGTFVRFLPFITVVTLISLALEVLQERLVGGDVAHILYPWLEVLLWSAFFYEVFAFFTRSDRLEPKRYLKSQIGFFCRWVGLMVLALLPALIPLFFFWRAAQQGALGGLVEANADEPVAVVGFFLFVGMFYFLLTLVYSRWGLMLPRYIAEVSRGTNFGGDRPRAQFKPLFFKLFQGLFIVSIVASAPEIYFSDKVSLDILNQDQTLNFKQLGISVWSYFGTAYASVLTARILCDAYQEQLANHYGEQELVRVFE